MNIEEMKLCLENSIPAKRYQHSLRVYETALDLAAKHKLPSEKIAISALLHDCGREVSSKESVLKAKELNISVDDVELNQPILLHAKIGVYNAKHKYGVNNREILDGILYHTTGTSGMSTLAKVVYLADMLEPKRDFPQIEKLRKLAAEDLDQAMLMAYSNTINYLLEEGLLIHPQCIAGYNELVLKTKNKQLE